MVLPCNGMIRESVSDELSTDLKLILSLDMGGMDVAMAQPTRCFALVGSMEGNQNRVVRKDVVIYTNFSSF